MTDNTLTMCAPAGRAAVTLATQGLTRISCYGWGDHPDVVNPGDMLLIARPADGVQIAVLVRGRDMALLADAAVTCAALYEENADWLSAPVTRQVAA